MPHGGFNRCEDHIQTHIDQIDPGERNDQVSTNNDALIQHVVEHLKQRNLIVGFPTDNLNLFRMRAHLEPALSRARDTNEYGGHGPVHSMVRSSAQRRENRVRSDSSFLRSLRLTRMVV